MSRNSNEYKLHIAIVKHIRSAFPALFFIHIPNQTRDATEAFFNKQLGVRKGAADLLFSWKDESDFTRMGVIELKSDKGRISSDQNKFLSAVDSLGWHTAVCHSVRGVHHTLTMWGLKADHTGIQEPDCRTTQEKFHDIHEMMKP